MADLTRTLGWEADAVAGVPLTPRRRRSRGYNQAEKIAHNLAMCIDIGHESALLRTRETRPQVGLSGTERRHNVAGAFRAEHPLSGRSLILVDDVLTTGATILACAEACLMAGARQVYGVTIAAEVDQNDVTESYRGK